MLANLTASRAASGIFTDAGIAGCSTKVALISVPTYTPLEFAKLVHVSLKPDESACYYTSSTQIILGKKFEMVAKWYNTKTETFGDEKSMNTPVAVSVKCTSRSTFTSCETESQVYFKITNKAESEDTIHFISAIPSFDYDEKGVHHADRDYYTTIKGYSIPISSSYKVTDGKITNQAETRINSVLPNDVKNTIKWEKNDGGIYWGGIFENIFGTPSSTDAEGSHEFKGPGHIYPSYKSKPTDKGTHKYSASFEISANDHGYQIFFGYIQNDNNLLNPATLLGPGGLPVWAYIVIAIVAVIIVISIIISIICCCCKGCKKCCCKKSKKSSSSSS